MSCARYFVMFALSQYCIQKAYGIFVSRLHLAYIWRPSISLAVFCFYSKTSFWPSYCQISTDLDKILQTPIVIRNTLVGPLRPRLACGRLQAKPERLCFFVILVAHPKSYIETTNRREITAANRQSGGEDGCYREKFLIFWRGRNLIQKTFFAF